MSDSGYTSPARSLLGLESFLAFADGCRLKFIDEEVVFSYRNLCQTSSSRHCPFVK